MPPAVVVPTPTESTPSNLELGDRYFNEGDYARAIAAYTDYLEEGPSLPGRDRALFHLALAYELPESSVHDSALATMYLRELLAQYPDSPMRPQARLLLESRKEIERLQSEIGSREERIGELTQQMGQLEQNQAELEKLRIDISQREQRIQQLAQELERLKQIDMQRRPASTP
jgi:tetratricopeptide (TPR) repeat protein